MGPGCGPDLGLAAAATPAADAPAADAALGEISTDFGRTQANRTRTIPWASCGCFAREYYGGGNSKTWTRPKET